VGVRPERLREMFKEALKEGSLLMACDTGTSSYRVSQV
jgi:hypothetical protein